MKTLDLKRKQDGTGGSNSTSSAAETVQTKNGNMPVSNAFEDKPKAEEAKSQIEVPQVELKKEESKPVAVEKLVLNLESTLKLVEELHRRKTHRDNLLNTIKTLDEFKVLVQDDESEDIESTQFQGCQLTIMDDDRNSFSTKNPFIIKAVAEFVNTLCVNKLAEIEANLVIHA